MSTLRSVAQRESKKTKQNVLQKGFANPAPAWLATRSMGSHPYCVPASQNLFCAFCDYPEAAVAAADWQRLFSRRSRSTSSPGDRNKLGRVMESSDRQVFFCHLDPLQGYGGSTPLHETVEMESDLCRLLIEKGCSLDAPDSAHLSTRLSRGNLSRLLIDGGCSLDVQTLGGNAPLRYAIHVESVELCKLPIDSSATTTRYYERRCFQHRVHCPPQASGRPWRVCPTCEATTHQLRLRIFCSLVSLCLHDTALTNVGT